MDDKVARNRAQFKRRPKRCASSAVAICPNFAPWYNALSMASSCGNAILSRQVHSTMSRQMWLRIVLLAALLLCFAPPAQGDSLSLQAGDASPSEWLVRVRDDLPSERARQMLQGIGLVPLREIPRIGVWVVEIPQGAPGRALSALQERGDVLWHEPNGAYELVAVRPNDPYYEPQQWNLRLIGLPDAWTLSLGDPRPIAIVDSGIDLTHPDLINKVWRNHLESAQPDGKDTDDNGYVDDIRGWNFVGGNNNPQDTMGHGSHVAGIAGAQTDNGLGIAGVSWLSPVMALRVCYEIVGGSRCPWGYVADAVIYAADMDAHVINLSLGSTERSQTVYDAIQYAHSRGALLVAAAGNNGSSVLYPAAFSEVMAIAATSSNDLPASWSNPGPEVEVAAPGVSIYSTYPVTMRQPPYILMSGTSMAAPHVAGLAALLWAYQPNATAVEIRQIITSTAKDVDTPGKDTRTGWGRIDAASALLSSSQPRIALTSATPSIAAIGGSSVLTAFATHDDGQPVPDGLSVSFSTNLGTVEPPTTVTAGGVATTTFSPTASGQATITATLGSYASDSVTITVLPPHIALTTTALSIPMRGGSALVTALITHHDGEPVPDGMTVRFDSDKGSLGPATALTAGGVVTATFIPSTYGEARVSAELVNYASETIVITVLPWMRIFFPHMRRH
jgi:subtilisin family serine protease